MKQTGFVLIGMLVLLAAGGVAALAGLRQSHMELKLSQNLLSQFQAQNNAYQALSQQLKLRRSESVSNQAALVPGNLRVSDPDIIIRRVQITESNGAGVMATLWCRTDQSKPCRLGIMRRLY